MLKNFLPKLNPLKLLKRDTAVKVENSSQTPETNLSPNLLNYDDDNFFTGAKHFSKIILFLRLAILIVLVAFSFSVVTNMVVGRVISSKSNNIDKLTAEIAGASSIIEESRNIVRKTNYHKELAGSQSNFGEIYETLYFLTPLDVELERVKFDKNKITITSSSPTPLIFSAMISNYFGSGLVSELVLRSATLDSRAQVFVVELEVLLK